MQPAQHVGEGALTRIEDLEDRSDLEQGEGHRNCVRILGRVDVNERRDQEPRRGDHRDRGQNGVDEREAEGAPARVRDRTGIVRAISKADPDRRRLAQAKRDHESDRHDLQGGRMRFERVAPDQAHRHGRGGEHAHFRKDHRAHWQPKPP